jgi:hypothetical protein
LKKLTLDNICFHLEQYDKIIVTGPPRSGTTISGLIISNILGYKFIDESWYDGNNSEKFLSLFSINRKMVIHNTAFLRDLYKISSYINDNNISIVLVKRSIDDILESFENSTKFDTGKFKPPGIFAGINQDAQKIILNHFGKTRGSVPKVIYEYFDSCKDKFDNLFFIKYEDLKSHSFFIEKEIRRKSFVHIKQVNEDPYYLTKKGVMVL